MVRSSGGRPFQRRGRAPAYSRAMSLNGKMNK